MTLMLIMAFFLGATGDTLKLPLANGIIKAHKPPNAFFESPEEVIYPSSSNKVQSCSAGVVVYVLNDFGRKRLMIKNKELIYSYTLDSVSVAPQHSILKGQEVGKFNKANINDSPLIFEVSKNGKSVKSIKYLIFE
jgi:hypothetical protein